MGPIMCKLCVNKSECVNKWGGHKNIEKVKVEPGKLVSTSFMAFAEPSSH